MALRALELLKGKNLKVVTNPFTTCWGSLVTFAWVHRVTSCQQCTRSSRLSFLRVSALDLLCGVIPSIFRIRHGSSTLLTSMMWARCIWAKKWYCLAHSNRNAPCITEKWTRQSGKTLMRHSSGSQSTLMDVSSMRQITSKHLSKGAMVSD